MTILNAILLALMLAIIVEALVEYGSTIYDMAAAKEYKKAVKQLCAIALGVTFCLAAGVDFFAEIGMTFHVPWMGVVVSGIVISRGANYTSDLVKRLQNMGANDTIVVNTTSETEVTTTEDYYPDADDVT